MSFLKSFNRYKQKRPRNWRTYPSSTIMFVGSGRWFWSYIYKQLGMIRDRLIFASADKVDAIWSRIASKLDWLSISAHLSLNPSSISRLRPLSVNLRTFDESGDVTGERDTKLSARHMPLHARCLRQKCRHGGSRSCCSRYARMLILRQVMKVLLRHHGVNLSGVKSDLYTVIGKCQTEAFKLHDTEFRVHM